jgi:hypothetical protein
MAGTFAVDTAATFSSALMMTSAPKFKFGTQVQDVSAGGLPKWTVEAAVTFLAEPGMRPSSEVISMTVTGPGDPGQGIPPGTLIAFDGFRIGMSAPEKNDRGGIRGGKAWYQAAAVRPANANVRAPRSDAA